MMFTKFFKITVMTVVAASSSMSLSLTHAQEGETKTKKVAEPVFRLSKLVAVEKSEPQNKAEAPAKTAKPQDEDAPRIAELPKTVVAPKTAPHPLDQALTFAKDSLAGMQNDIYDYTATMAKREQIKGKLSDMSFMQIKVRCPRTDAQGEKKPFSLYMRFLKPRDTTGREVIWVDGKFENKIVAHEGRGLVSMRTWHLDPTGMLAMQGQRYPIYDAGIENLILKLIEKADRDRAAGPCKVNYHEDLSINKRKCSMIELIHDERRLPYEFHKAQVFVDDELNLPVRYVAFDWPTRQGEKPRVLEEYTYFNIKTNVGLTDLDFDPANPAYKYPGN